MQYIVMYVAALVVFVAIDASWLSLMGNALYRPVLGDILLPTLRVPPAIVFYAIFPIGIVAFAAIPAVRAGAVGTALLWGLLFGAIAYATYDLTNYATLRNWTCSSRWSISSTVRSRARSLPPRRHSSDGCCRLQPGKSTNRAKPIVADTPFGSAAMAE